MLSFPISKVGSSCVILLLWAVDSFRKLCVVGRLLFTESRFLLCFTILYGLLTGVSYILLCRFAFMKFCWDCVFVRFYPTLTRISRSGTSFLRADCLHLDGRRSPSRPPSGDCIMVAIWDSFVRPIDLVNLLCIGLALCEDRFNYCDFFLVRIEFAPRLREFVGELSS